MIWLIYLTIGFIVALGFMTWCGGPPDDSSLLKALRDMLIFVLFWPFVLAASIEELRK